MGITHVAWSNQTTNDSGTASGTESWSVADIALVEGDNAITISVSDGVGNTGHDQISVHYSTSGSSDSGGSGCFIHTLVRPVN